MENEGIGFRHVEGDMIRIGIPKDVVDIFFNTVDEDVIHTKRFVDKLDELEIVLRRLQQDFTGYELIEQTFLMIEDLWEQEPFQAYEQLSEIYFKKYMYERYLVKGEEANRSYYDEFTQMKEDV